MGYFFPFDREGEFLCSVNFIPVNIFVQFPLQLIGFK